MERDASTLDAQRRRARRVALALAELDEDVPTTEQRLHRWKVHPVVAHEAAVWAHRLVVARDPEIDLHPPEVSDVVGPSPPGPRPLGRPRPAPAPPAATPIPGVPSDPTDLGGAPATPAVPSDPTDLGGDAA